MSKVIDINERLFKRQREEVIEKAGGADYVAGMQAEQEAELKAVEDEVRGYCDSLMDDLLEFGIADESVEFSTDFIFMSEALRSMIMRARGFEHFVQSVADKLIEVEYDPETDMITGKWNIDGLLEDDPVIESYGPEAFTDIEELAKTLLQLTEDDDKES